ncbi:hypothetical protein MSG28_008495 [Choristoneura fumiferana]|uniref:Uncharacterized protein n=1 Tax=Choristoneura fumiferana TaxID=7141 RepID=A0ACC0J681_CHOFU|nr:hypothetical protein MSG28_008495 [Choristoneura fumiferana]
MAHVQFVDELVREYLLYRGFTTTVKAFDTDLKADKDKGFRVDKIVDQILHYINVSDLNGFKEYWSHLDSLVFSKLEIHVQPAVKKLEYSLYKLYLITAAQGTGGVKNERVTEFFAKMLPELQGQNEWRDWCFLISKSLKRTQHSAYSSPEHGKTPCWYHCKFTGHCVPVHATANPDQL